MKRAQNQLHESASPGWANSAAFRSLRASPTQRLPGQGRDSGTGMSELRNNPNSSGGNTHSESENSHEQADCKGFHEFIITLESTIAKAT